MPSIIDGPAPAPAASPSRPAFRPLAGPHDDSLGAAAPLGAPVWTALHYRLPGASAGLRSAMWRDLGELGAVNLQYGVWAVPHGLDTAPRAAVLERIRAAGGDVDVRTIGSDRDGDLDPDVDGGLPEPEDAAILQVRLHRACERLWDSFFNRADLLRSRLALGTVTPDEARVLLDDLVADHAATLGRDLARSDASHRARALLDACAGAILGTGPVEPGPTPPGVRYRVELSSAHRLDDGTIRLTAVLAPAPAAAWTRAMEQFEQLLYTASPDRAVASHGTFTWVGETARVDEALARLDHRVDHFLRFAG